MYKSLRPSQARDGQMLQHCSPRTGLRGPLSLVLNEQMMKSHCKMCKFSKELCGSSGSFQPPVLQAQKSQGWSRGPGGCSVPPGCATPQSSRSPQHTSTKQAQQAPLSF